MTEIIWDAPSKRGGEFDRGQPLNERQGGGLFGELAYFQTIASIGPVWRTCLFSNKYILISACSENLPIFKQIHINKCFFGELAIGSRQDDRDEAEGEEVDAGDHKETPFKFVSVVRTK